MHTELEESQLHYMCDKVRTFVKEGKAVKV